jgi:hypothetical protein
LPATVELSVLTDGVWKMKSYKSLLEEVEWSFKSYGYAAIVTHPQEFMFNGTLNSAATESFVSLISTLSETCQFTTFEKLNLFYN